MVYFFEHISSMEKKHLIMENYLIIGIIGSIKVASLLVNEEK